MKLFQAFEKIFTLVTIRVELPKNPPNPNSKTNVLKPVQVQVQPYGLRNLIPQICFGYGAGSTGVFLFVEARTFQDLSEALYGLVTMILNICNFTVLFCNGAKILELIDKFESSIQTRKRKAFSELIKYKPFILSLIL